MWCNTSFSSHSAALYTKSANLIGFLVIFYLNVRFSTCCGTNEANIFLTHGWESEYKCVAGVKSLRLYKVQFLFCHLLLPDMPNPTMKYFWSLLSYSEFIFESLFSAIVRKICLCC